MKNLPYICYFFWSDDGLGEFKRRCGFQRLDVPRYFVPLTRKGEIAIRFGLHLGAKRLLPPRVEESLKAMRGRLYAIRYGGA